MAVAVCESGLRRMWASFMMMVSKQSDRFPAQLGDNVDDALVFIVSAWRVGPCRERSVSYEVRTIFAAVSWDLLKRMSLFVSFPRTPTLRGSASHSSPKYTAIQFLWWTVSEYTYMGGWSALHSTDTGHGPMGTPDDAAEHMKWGIGTLKLANKRYPPVASAFKPWPEPQIHHLRQTSP